MDPHHQTTRWSVLIGIDFYVTERSLRGSVADVNSMKQFLESGCRPVDLAILTATAPSQTNSRFPTEDRDDWPTFANITKALTRILSNAKRGDSVYIHYAGHGTRVPRVDKSEQSSENLALVLFEGNGPGMSYFRGELLANCLQKMVNHGLLVTVVLDCCYSGSVLRDDVPGTDIRALTYSPQAGSELPVDCLPGIFRRDESDRDARMQSDQWLVDPNGYAILAACGPHEIARELELTTGERRGALSYFLIDALGDLGRRGIAVTLEVLYEHVRIRFRASWPQQRPMRYGNSTSVFLGDLGLASVSTFIQTIRSHNRLLLDAGAAHGVHIGDEYDVWSFGDAAEAEGDAVRLRVKAVHGLTSELVGDQDGVVMKQVQTGWKAKQVSLLPHHKVSVRLLAGIHGCFEDLGEKKWLKVCPSENTMACDFNIALNENREYEILDGSLQRISSLPTLAVELPEANIEVLSILQHLAKFKYMEILDNQLPNPSFETSFSMHGHAVDVAPRNSAISIVAHGGIWRLEVINLGKAPLYMTVFNLTPSWAISNVLSSAGDSPFRVIEPGSMEEIWLMMEVPDFLRSLGVDHCEEVIKAFITSEPTSFPSVILPSIHQGLRRHHDHAYADVDALSELLESLSTYFREENSLRQEEWATRNFIVHTQFTDGHI